MFKNLFLFVPIFATITNIIAAQDDVVVLNDLTNSIIKIEDPDPTKQYVYQRTIHDFEFGNEGNGYINYSRIRKNISFFNFQKQSLDYGTQNIYVLSPKDERELDIALNQLKNEPGYKFVLDLHKVPLSYETHTKLSSFALPLNAGELLSFIPPDNISNLNDKMFDYLQVRNLQTNKTGSGQFDYLFYNDWVSFKFDNTKLGDIPHIHSGFGLNEISLPLEMPSLFAGRISDNKNLVRIAISNDTKLEQGSLHGCDNLTQIKVIMNNGNERKITQNELALALTPLEHEITHFSFADRADKHVKPARMSKAEENYFIDKACKELGFNNYKDKINKGNQYPIYSEQDINEAYPDRFTEIIEKAKQIYEDKKYQKSNIGEGYYGDRLSNCIIESCEQLGIIDIYEKTNQRDKVWIEYADIKKAYTTEQANKIIDKANELYKQDIIKKNKDKADNIHIQYVYPEEDDGCYDDIYMYDCIDWDNPDGPSWRTDQDQNQAARAKRYRYRCNDSGNESQDMSHVDKAVNKIIFS